MNSIAEEMECLGEKSNSEGTNRDDDLVTIDLENNERNGTGTSVNLRRRSPQTSEKGADSPFNYFRTPLTSNRSSSTLGTPSRRRSNRLSTPRKFMSLRAAFSPPKQFTSFLSPKYHRSHSSRKKRTSENGSRLGASLSKQTVDDYPESSCYCGPTRLHDACYKATSLKQLCPVIDSFHQGAEYGLSGCVSQLSTAASAKDDDGRIPLHLISENKRLSFALMRKADPHDTLSEPSPADRIKSLVTTVLDDLLDASPTSVLETDIEGYIPFEHALIEWIDETHDTNRLGRLQKSGSSNSLGTQIESSIQQVVNTSISVSKAALTKAGRSLNKNTAAQATTENDQTPSTINVSESDDTINSKNSNVAIEEANSEVKPDQVELLPHDLESVHDRFVKGKLKSVDARDSKFPHNVKISTHAEFSLRILSAICEKLEKHALEEEKRARSVGRGGKSVASVSTNAASGITRNIMTEIIASIPNLVKTMLIIENEQERREIFALPIVRRVMSSKEAVGRWLTFMLQSHNKCISNRAVDYLQLLSTVLEENQNKTSSLGGKVTNLDELPEAVRALEDLIPSMLALDEKTMEQAATTPIIRRVLDKMITRPFAVSVVFFDSLFLAALIVSFRGSVSTFLSGHKPETVMIFIYFTNAMIYYFLVRELGKAISLSTITKRAFWLKFFWGFWNIVDILSIIMALISEFVIRNNLSDNPLLDESSNSLRACLAVTTGLLWLKVLGLLKTINMQLATFVLAIVQITRDILWFLLILFAAVVSFAQMFYTLLLPPYCAQRDVDKISAECSPAEYYLKVYSILLGDFGTFDREDFYTVFSVVLFVLFSFMVVIVLLNVLIAIVSDSYEKCLLRSQLLFGRARVMLLAELVSFQNLLRKKNGHTGGEISVADSRIQWQWWRRQGWEEYTTGGFIFVSLSMSVILLLFTAEMAGYATGNHYGNIQFSFLSISFNIVILVALVFFLSQGPGGMTESAKGSDDRFRCCACWYTNSIQRIMLKLLGTSEESTFASNSDDGEEWRGRMNYIQGEMVRLSAESTAHTKADVKALEQELRSSESRIRSELDALESRIMQSNSTIMAEINEAERRIEKIIRGMENEGIEDNGARNKPRDMSRSATI